MSKKPVILAADDEENNLRVIEGMLLPLGYQVVFARNGEEAVRKANEETCDVALLDVMMPVLNGLDAAKLMKSSERTRDIPIVMVTSLDGVDERVKALESGADDFLTKPVDATELRARVKSLVQVKAYHDHIHDYKNQLESEVALRTAELKSALERVKESRLESVYRLSRAAEYKDEDTGEHILRMSNYAAAVAESMGLGHEFVGNLLYSSTMHDVGKIGIPDIILLKPEKLNADEWEIMKSHTWIGGGILEGSESEFIRMAERVALTHHERWDGSGYPQGLADKEIPLEGRITAIADVFDALTTRRPYKKPFDLDMSFSIIKEGSGTHFDPSVAEAFFAAEKRILAIKESYADTEESTFVRMTMGLYRDRVLKLD